jgi:2-polyprenyl-3-methyl-5-hydroxy-6-metoxy-1,4-benzoquinol methylase
METTVSSVKESIEHINGLIYSSPSTNPVRVLEAGCGSLSHIQLPSESFIVGVDISQEQLSRNEVLDKAVLGNIEDSSLFDRQFDIIVCWDVLEHVDNPERALENFAKSLSDNGLLIVKVPNILSFKGLVTKYTPHSFHVLVYKYIFGKSDAGKPGRPPFPTTMRDVIAPTNMRDFCRELGLQMSYSSTFDALPRNVREKPVLNSLYSIASGITGLVTLQKVGGQHKTDFVGVFTRPASQD